MMMNMYIKKNYIKKDEEEEEEKLNSNKYPT